ncbi:thioesterase [Moraxella caviae]|uniref:Acyl-CoA thioester hydrolase YbgC n=1 Tax=Moraxella caviae TaxID=34060 RepID=A0A1T0A2R6_9GAMM|nr:hotdog domain-containing protein [Moraxella caviae]OOR90066.1 thioesterase [Moraxella caviae]STZ14673.1 Acyl-CoA thioester hydrolase YbgC [Moraxella caviae]
MSIFSTRYKVYINHTDAGGIVYHANHLTFFENCRRDWLTSLGFDGYFFDDDGTAAHGGRVHFVVSHADLSYKLPLLVDDLLVVSIENMVKKSASLILTQHIYQNEADYHAGKVASVGVITLACVCNTPTGIRPQRLPAAFLKAVE